MTWKLDDSERNAVTVMAIIALLAGGGIITGIIYVSIQLFRWIF